MRAGRRGSRQQRCRAPAEESSACASVQRREPHIMCAVIFRWFRRCSFSESHAGSNWGPRQREILPQRALPGRSMRLRSAPSRCAMVDFTSYIYSHIRSDGPSGRREPREAPGSNTLEERRPAR